MKRVARALVALLLIITTCFPITSTAIESNWLFEVTSKSAYVREGASASSDVVAKLYEGDLVYVKAYRTNQGSDVRWFKCEVLESGETGYISERFVTECPHEEDEDSDKYAATIYSIPCENSAYKDWLLSTSTTKVYVTKDGRCFHFDRDCSNMKNPYKITLEDAKEQGYRQCSKCW